MKKKLTILYVVLTILVIFQIFISQIWQFSFWGVYPEFVLWWIWIAFSIAMIIIFRKKLMSKIAIGIFVAFIILNLFTMGIPALFVFSEISPAKFHFQQKVSPTLRFEMNTVFLGKPILKAYERRLYFFEKEVEIKENISYMSESSVLKNPYPINSELISYNENSITFQLKYMDMKTKTVTVKMDKE